MSKSNAQQYQSIDADDDQTLRAHDIAMSQAGRAIRDILGVEGSGTHGVPPTFEELAQLRRIVYEDTARACAKEMQN